jgi:hypothetical protein
MMSTPSGGPARQPAVLPFPSRTDIDLKHLRAFVEVADGLSLNRAAQFGYWIAPDARGRGYATRAASCSRAGCSTWEQLASS